MIAYLCKIIAEFAKFDDSPKTANSLAANHLFQVNNTAKHLNDAKATVFHCMMAKALFLMKWAWLDILTAVAFLTTWVKNLDVNDWKKLIQMIWYLKGSINLPLVLHADSTPLLKWWVNGLHATHSNCQGHLGGCLSLGAGTPILSSMKQKINTHSSTKSELIAVDDFMPMILWTNLFLEVQGYGSCNTIIYQDNQSAILLKKNGRKSSSRCTWHLNICYYFISNRINTRDIKVEFCPMDDMIVDFFTKPLQGKTFLKFQDLIMNLD